MRGLTAIEREMLEDAAFICAGEGESLPWTDEESQAVQEMLNRGLILLGSSYCEYCEAKHNAITSDGILALRIDSLARSEK